MKHVEKSKQRVLHPTNVAEGYIDLFGNCSQIDEKVLHLTLRKKWFDKILCGRKHYEFREAKNYWKSRLEQRTYTVIHFKNGYGSNVPMMKVEFGGVQKRRIKGLEHYCIRLGRILETQNLSVKDSMN